MVKQISFKIDKQGKVELDVSGFTGNGCEDFSKAFEEILGQTTEKTLKDTYYQTESTETAIEGELK